MPELIEVPAGSVELRDARSDSSRKAGLVPFALGRTQVTQSEWSAVLGLEVLAAPEIPAHAVTWFDAVRWCNTASSLAGYASAYEIDGRDVTWDVGADGFRLPTEAEWHWACTGGTGRPRYGDLADIGWTMADGVPGPQDVGLKAANPFGLFDMLGNVWEWCWDFADTARYADYRSLRGGGWADPEWSCRAAVRRGSAPDAVLEDVGFRVARGPVGEPGAEAAQGWSAEADRSRAGIRGPLPVGWTPYRELLKR